MLEIELKGNVVTFFKYFFKILDKFRELRVPLDKLNELRIQRPIRQDRTRVPLCCLPYWSKLFYVPILSSSTNLVIVFLYIRNQVQEVYWIINFQYLK